MTAARLVNESFSLTKDKQSSCTRPELWNALGAYSWPSPGDMTGHLEAFQAPHGRIRFAGEHTSVLQATT